MTTDLLDERVDTHQKSPVFDDQTVSKPGTDSIGHYYEAKAGETPALPVRLPPVPALPGRPASPVPKDNWDKLAAVAPIISGMLIFLMGGFFTYTFNQQQLRLQEIQTIEKFIPHLMGNEQSKKAAILAIKNLTNAELATKFASIFASSGTVSALQTMAESGTAHDKTVAESALNEALHSLAERESKLSTLEKLYEEALAKSKSSGQAVDPLKTEDQNGQLRQTNWDDQHEKDQREKAESPERSGAASAFEVKSSAAEEKKLRNEEEQRSN